MVLDKRGREVQEGDTIAWASPSSQCGAMNYGIVTDVNEDYHIVTAKAPWGKKFQFRYSNQFVLIEAGT